MNLLETNRTLGAHIEFTTNCNLKCVYCAVQNKDYLGRDLDLDSIELFIDQLKTRNVLEVTVSGHGETTTIENWHIHCNHLLTQGCKLNIITNLSKQLSEEEIDTFSQFNFILVSCDSVDLQIFKRLRKGSDFRTVLYNISSILGKSRSKNRQLPMIGWTTVVCDKNVLGLVDLVNFGLSYGVTFFSFSRDVFNELRTLSLRVPSASSESPNTDGMGVTRLLVRAWGAISLRSPRKKIPARAMPVKGKKK